MQMNLNEHSAFAKYSSYGISLYVGFASIFQRVRENGKKKKRTKVIVTKYIPNGNAPFVRKLVLFRQVAEDVKKKKSAWHAPPKLRPRSRPWSAMVRRLRMARNNTISPMPPIPPLRHRMHGKSRINFSRSIFSKISNILP